MTRPEAMALAREMYGDWATTHIAQYLRDRGVQVSDRTVKRWATGDDGSSENRRRTERARDTRVMARMTELRARGLSVRAVSMVLSVDHGKEVTADQVRYCLDRGSVSRDLRWLLFGGNEFVTGALRVAGPVVESRPESTRGEPKEGGYDARLPTPTPFGGVA